MPDASSILVFGGTFDPPHRAHVELPRRVAQACGCERILYVPARISPLKLYQPPTADAHRLAMLQLALQDESHVQISTIELMREGPSYTVDTLRTLREELGDDATLRLLIGTDQALAFTQWKDWQAILDLAMPAVMLRPPHDRDAFAAALADVYDDALVQAWLSWTVAVPMLAVSATEIRTRLLDGRHVDDLLPDAVAAYIYGHGLYGVGA
jgi:nicotinate-nucleotide adenylyltransferase